MEHPIDAMLNQEKSPCLVTMSTTASITTSQIYNIDHEVFITNIKIE